MSAPTCSCGRLARLVSGREVYPHRPDLHERPFWLCEPCQAYVGCHPGTSNPLGTPASLANRKARSFAHHALDKLWRGEGAPMSRSEAYEWLSAALEIHPDKCHIGMFDIPTCNRVVELAQIRAAGGAHAPHAAGDGPVSGRPGQPTSRAVPRGNSYSPEAP